MVMYRLFLAFIIATVGIYTFPVVSEFGIIVLLPSFFGEIGEVNWQGQFNLDFLMFLLMSGFWIAWRNNFTRKGIALGIGGFFLGAPCSIQPPPMREESEAPPTNLRTQNRPTGEELQTLPV